MIGFTYYNPAKIVFGEGSEKQLTELLRQHQVRSLLLVYSGDFIKDLGIYAEVEKAVSALGIHFTESGEVVPNPDVDLVRSLLPQALGACPAGMSGGLSLRGADSHLPDQFPELPFRMPGLSHPS